VQAGYCILYENLSCLMEKSSLSIKDNKTINTFVNYLKELLKIELDLKRMCPENAQELQFEPQDDIAQSIIRGNFVSAEVQLLLISGDDAVYDNFVQKVYNETSGLFKLLNFGHFISNAERKFKLYDAVYRAMKSNNDVNIFTVLTLHRNLMTKIFPLSHFYSSWYIKLFCQLWVENRNLTFDLVAAALLLDARHSIAKQTKDNIIVYCSDLFYSVISEMVEKVHGKTNSLELLEKIHRNVYDMDEKIMYYERIMNRLELDQKLYEDLIIPMVQGLKMMWYGPPVI
ncbi:hypothetical protein U1Q18_051209, partial [Sarracenia purpurea var. burkii]